MSEKKRFGIVACANDPKWGGAEGCGRLLADVFAGEGEEWVVFKACEGQPPTIEDLDKFHGFLISGSPFSVNEDKPWMIELEKVIQTLAERRTRAVGVCFGHQLIGKALGGKVGWNPSQRFVFKAEDIEVSDGLLSKSWFKKYVDTKRTLKLLETHSESVLEPPPGSKVLARSGTCENEALLFGRHDNILGVQFHPELTSEMMKGLILPSLKQKNLLTAEEEASGLASMEKKLDSQVMLDILINFLHQ